MTKIDGTFIVYASDILADTYDGLTGTQIVKYCNAYALDFNRIIPYNSVPLEAPNKRTALAENLRQFEAVEQFRIIKELSELPELASNEKVKEMRSKLYSRYPQLATDRITETELVQKTKHWLSDFPDALRQYESALDKYEKGIFERNTLDDMRLSFELLVKSILNNNRSLENQIGDIGALLKNKGASVELRNMVPQTIKYYTDFQNSHVKHNDSVNSQEIEYVIELTSVLMKFLIKVNGGTNNG